MNETSGSRLRRDRERADMRVRLLAAARQIAVEEGWPAVTIRRIADRLQYASPILYQHFAGKDGLLLELARDGFAQVAEVLRAAVDDAPADHVATRLADAYWEFAFASPELYQVMHGLAGVPFGTADTPREAREAFQVCRSALVTVRPGLSDPDGAVDTLWAYLHGWVALTMSGRIAGSRDRARTLMLRGLPGLLGGL
ncbi:MAG: TetR/AcrR family transcriptional regulator [Hamadaea sp.]|uniref:TetR/AcrR family transcriptional regulator n=1 Tax=Hamadaea sp. TaxID=2024425 RepID=UPI00184D4D77|nr:TetR/AcrR family transcriptional regulator [Hamadaea sp.]NUT20695.1 TetR/AcrR family transcriptional regulator [Hamadaea sp.]